MEHFYQQAFFINQLVDLLENINKFLPLLALIVLIIEIGAIFLFILKEDSKQKHAVTKMEIRRFFYLMPFMGTLEIYLMAQKLKNEVDECDSDDKELKEAKERLEEIVNRKGQVEKVKVEIMPGS